MARIVRKRKQRRLRIGSLVNAIITLSFVLFLGTTIFLRSYNLQLTKEVQTIQENTTQLQLQNDNLEKDIAKLQDRERIVSIAKQAGLDIFNNITTIKAGE